MEKEFRAETSWEKKEREQMEKAIEKEAKRQKKQEKRKNKTNGNKDAEGCGMLKHPTTKRKIIIH